MRPFAASILPLALLASSCDGSSPEKKPLPPPISLGTPSGGAPPAGGAQLPPGHPPATNPHGDDAPKPPAPPPPSAPSRFKAPEGWQAETPASAMRTAQYRVPRADGDAKDAEVAVFGNAMGSTQANIERWRGQFGQVAQGKDRLEEITEGLKAKVTLLDITGKYSAGAMGGPGAPPDAGAEVTRMIAAIIESPDGTFYVKATGPEATIGKWEKSIRDFILGAAK